MGGWVLICGFLEERVGFCLKQREGFSAGLVLCCIVASGPVISAGGGIGCPSRYQETGDEKNSRTEWSESEPARHS